jgi:hypothetical protein
MATIKKDETEILELKILSLVLHACNQLFGRMEIGGLQFETTE